MILEKAIFKVGGSILEHPKYLKNTISQIQLLVQEKLIQTVIIISGGGSYANFIRDLDKQLEIGSTIAHWMAIYAMDYNGTKIWQQYPSIKLTNNFEELKKKDYQISIFLPLNYLKELDPLPHSWDVTSDAITLFLTHKLQLEQSFLIKDVDGILDQHNEILKNLSSSTYSHMKESGLLANIGSIEREIKKSKPIDNYSLEIINSYNLSCLLLNGAVNDLRIYQYFASTNESDKIYTKIASD